MDNVDENTSADSRKSTSQRDTYHTHYDWSTPESVSLTVIRAIAAVTGKKTDEVTPLYTCLDPEALDALFRPTRETPRAKGQVSFTLDGQTVTIHGDGRIVINPVDEQDG